MRRIVLALLSLAVMLPSVAQARACWMTDLAPYVREACCCPPPAEATPGSAEIVVAKAPATIAAVCCKIEKRTQGQLPIAHPAAAPPIAAVIVTSIAVVPVAPPLGATAVAIIPRAQAPPSSSTLLAQHRGLLL
jgi:hypothetical protein